MKANEVIVLGDFAENYQFCNMKSKVTIGVKNTAHCTHLLYILLTVMEIIDTILCFFSDDYDHDTNFVYKIQTILVDYLEENLPIVDKIFYLSDGSAEQYKNRKNFINFCHNQQDFNMGAEWISLQLVMASHHAMVLGDLLNVMLQNVVYKDPYITKFCANNQCLIYV